MFEEVLLKRRFLKKRDDSDCEYVLQLVDNEKELESDLLEVIDESDK